MSLVFSTPEDTQPLRQQQEPSAQHLHPQAQYPLSPNPVSPGGSQAGLQVPQDGTWPQSEEQQPTGCFWTKQVPPPNGHSPHVSIIFSC